MKKGIGMMEIIFNELRKCNLEIASILDESEHEAGKRAVVKAIQTIGYLCNTAKEEGLLALEQAVMDMDYSPNVDYLQRLFLYIVDGIDPDMVMEMGLFRYFTENYKAYDALVHLIFLEGSISIQTGYNPDTTKRKLLAMVPKDIELMYLEEAKELDQEIYRSFSADLSEYSPLFKGEIAVSPGDEKYFSLKVTDFAIQSLDDKSTQRLLREVCNGDLEIAMKGLSGKARKKLIDNMPEEQAIMIVEDMEYAGPVSITYINDAVEKIFDDLMRLINEGEICCIDSSASVLEAFYKALSGK